MFGSIIWTLVSFVHYPTLEMTLCQPVVLVGFRNNHFGNTLILWCLSDKLVFVHFCIDYLTHVASYTMQFKHESNEWPIFRLVDCNWTGEEQTSILINFKFPIVTELLDNVVGTWTHYFVKHSIAILARSQISQLVVLIDWCIFFMKTRTYFDIQGVEFPCMRFA